MRRHEPFESGVSKEREPTLFLDWELPTDIGQVDGSVEKLEKLLVDHGWPQEDAYKASVAFNEWLVNAIVHGNLELEYGQMPKGADWSKWVLANQNHAHYQDRKVFVKVQLNSRRLVVEIQDQGKRTEKFWNQQQDPTAGENLLENSGRGMLLAKTFVNEVHFEKNETGTKVTLVRDLEKSLPELFP